MLNAIRQEAKLQQHYLAGEKVDTIYFGGGTPSLLEEKEIQELLEQLYQTVEVSEEVELTLEANPDDLTKAKLKSLKSSGINRISIGVQSFQQKDLDFFNRSHNAQQAIDSIKRSQDNGFENLNIDLIFGAQTTTDQMWEANLGRFFSLNVPHLSSYSLTIEEKTALAHNINTGKSERLDEDKNYRHYLSLQNAIKAHDYQQYELSNYCKGDRISKHNTSYWFGKKYLGLGPSAHSYNGKSRQWNVANNIQYIKALQNQQFFYEKEELSELDLYHEYLLTRLRTKWGIQFSDFASNFSVKTQEHFFSRIKKLNPKSIIKTESSLRLPTNGLFRSDEVVRELMC